MSDTKKNASNSAWDAIEAEKKRDRFIRKVCTIAWTVTAIIGLTYATLVGIQIYELTLGALAGGLPWMSVAGAAIPFIVSLGTFSVLVATVATIGMFVRMRAASLHEIQLRLAALEDMLATRGGTSA